ncbi:MAG: FHA domain-containing protein [Coriobacteriales bacterium]|nr:FHA domain-containing protein [Coriobacteriales bacterium]
MYDWCHSGLEGYCKAAATLLGEEASDDVVLRLCQDLLPDRSAKNLTRAWTFSNVRRGRDCRQSIFEKAWLDGRHGKVYAQEATDFVKGVLPAKGFATIPQDSEYALLLQTARNLTECEDIAIRRCEADAIEACVDGIVELSQDDDKSFAEERVAYIASIVMLDHFSELFFDEVVPAIERGFLSERYSSADARQFVMTLGSLMDGAHRSVMAEDSDFEEYRAFLRVLVAGLVYGPRHPLAIDREWDETDEYRPYHGTPVAEGTTIRLTQVFDADAVYTGYSDLLRSSQLMFFGKSPRVEEYLRHCRELFCDDQELLALLRTREATVFPMALHDAVSNMHGMLVCEGDVWRLYDLGSTNGTSIESADHASAVKNLIEVRPGDRIRLGAPANADDANVYWSAATILVSLNIDRTEELV